MTSVFTMPDGSNVKIETISGKVHTTFLTEDFEPAAEVANDFTLCTMTEQHYHEGIRKHFQQQGLKFHSDRSTVIK